MQRVIGSGVSPNSELVSLMNEVSSRYAPVNVAAGSHLVDPNAGTPIFSAPHKPTSPLVNLNMGGRVDEMAAKAGFGSVKEGWEKVESMSDNVAVLDTALQDMNTFETGLGSKYRLIGEQAKSFMGGNPEAAAAGERMQTLINQDVLGKMSYLKGAMSEKELKFLQDSTISMENTPAGNTAIIEVYRKAADRQRKKAQMKENYYYDNNYSLKGFNKAWDEEKKSWEEGPGPANQLPSSIDDLLKKYGT